MSRFANFITIPLMLLAFESSAFALFEDFHSAPTTCQSDGATFGVWKVEFAGFGCVKKESTSSSTWLHLQPTAPANTSETHATLVTGPSFTTQASVPSYYYQAKVRTVSQLRNPSPNAWEVAWLVFDYIDNDHFYYFTLKPNGWELGKRDPAYPGGQRFLATGTTPTLTLNTWSRFEVQRDNTSNHNNIQIYIGNSLIVDFTDTERPYLGGKIGMYTEDAHVDFTNVDANQN